MKRSIIYLLPLFALLASCGTEESNRSGNQTSNVFEEIFTESPPKELTEEELKTQLKNKECSTPIDYVTGSIESKWKYKNALSLKVTGMKLKCKLRSNATLATIKDAQFRVTLTSKTGSTVKEEIVTVHEYIKPGKSLVYDTEMSLTNQQYKDTDTWKYTLISAGCQ